MEFKLALSMPANSLTTPVDPNAIYDVIIIGGGPAGLTAAVYALRKGMKIALLTHQIGGQVVDTKNIQNYMGYTFIEGTELANKFFEQVQQFPAAVETGVDVQTLERTGNLFTASWSTNRARGKTVIIAAGKSYRKLGVPGEKELTGKGIAYCATCDAPLFAGKEVAIIGGGNSALETALELSAIAKNVTLFQNLESLTADKILIDKFNVLKNARSILSSKVLSFYGTDRLEKLTYLQNGKETEFSCDGAFIEIGLIPNTAFLGNLVKLNKQGEIAIDDSCNTSMKGIFAAGDISSVPEKQIIVAAGEGAKATLSAFRYLSAQ